MKIRRIRRVCIQVVCLYALSASTNANSAEVFITYDDAGQVQLIEYEDGSYIQLDHDGAGNRLFQEVFIAGPQELVIVPRDPSGRFPGGVIGGNYSEALVASGGVPPYDWSIVAGSLPQGLVLNESSGLISGSPTELGTFNITVQVSDSLGSNSSDSIVFKIIDLNWLPAVLFSVIDD